MRTVLIVVVSAILFSLGAVSAQEISLPPCSITQLESADSLVEEFDSLVVQAASVETIGELLDFGAAQLAWRESTWSRMTFCAEIFELALLIDQVTETMISGRVLSYAGVEQENNPYVESGFASARRFSTLEGEIDKMLESRGATTPSDGGLSKCTPDQRRYLADNLTPLINDVVNHSSSTETTDSVLHFLEMQLSWRKSIWSMLPLCTEAYEVTLIAHDYLSDIGNIQIFDLAEIPQSYNPFYDTFFDKVFQLSDFRQWLDVTGADYGSLPSCGETTIDAGLHKVFTRHKDLATLSVDSAIDLSGFATAHIEWRKELWSRLSHLPPCAEAFEVALLTMQITGDAVSRAALSSSENGLFEVSAAYGQRIASAGSRIGELMQTLNVAGDSAELPSSGNLRHCSDEDLNLIYDDGMKSTELFLSAYEIETADDLVAYIQDKFEWRDRLWSALPGCAEIFDFVLLLLQTAGDYATSVSLDLAGVSPDSNPYPDEISSSHDQIARWAEEVWPTPSSFATPSAIEPKTYYVNNAGRGATLHSCPSYDCSIDGLALHGEAIDVVDDGGEWYQVDLGIGLVLYVHSEFMSAAPPEG